MKKLKIIFLTLCAILVPAICFSACVPSGTTSKHGVDMVLLNLDEHPQTLFVRYLEISQIKNNSTTSLYKYSETSYGYYTISPNVTAVLMNTNRNNSTTKNGININKLNNKIQFKVKIILEDTQNKQYKAEVQTGTIQFRVEPNNTTNKPLEFFDPIDQTYKSSTRITLNCSGLQVNVALGMTIGLYD